MLLSRKLEYNKNKSLFVPLFHYKQTYLISSWTSELRAYILCIFYPQYFVLLNVSSNVSYEKVERFVSQKFDKLAFPETLNRCILSEECFENTGTKTG